MRSVVLIALFLAACATPEQRAASSKWYADNIYGPQCEGLGMKKDTDEYRSCLVQMATKK